MATGTSLRRQGLVRAHRALGLALALFLLVASASGSVIAFWKELDAWLNPALHRAAPGGAVLPLARLAERVEAALPGIRVVTLVPPATAGATALAWVTPRPGQPKPGFDQVFIDPYRGTILGTRLWGAARLDRAHLLPFLYKLHYTLHLKETGLLLMGLAALLWLIDTLIAVRLALPRQGPWRRVFTLKWGASAMRLNFDLHRAGGLAAALLLGPLAFTGAAMNLRAWALPLVSAASPVAPTSAEFVRALPVRPWPEAAIDWDKARRAAQDVFHDAHVISVQRDPERALYQVRLRSADDISDNGTLRLVIDAADGALRYVWHPRVGSGGDRFFVWQYPLHSGQALGLPGRIVTSAGGLATALLVVTGLVLWVRKRRSRAGGRLRRASRCPSGTADSSAGRPCGSDPAAAPASGHDPPPCRPADLPAARG